MLEHTNETDIAPARVVLLGGSGFVGTLLSQRLQERDVACLSISTPDIDLTADGADQALAARLSPEDVVVMLAAITPNRGRGVDAFMGNLAMAANLAKAIEAVPPAHLIYFSSDTVYPMAAQPFREETCTAPDDVYGMMHKAREVLLQSVCACPIALLRPSLIYGGADTHNSYGPNRLRRMARDDGRITLFGEGEEQRDHILVDDVAALTLRVIFRRGAGALNLATGNSVSYAALAKLVAAQFDDPIEIVGTPRQNPITHCHFDIAALTKAFPDFAFTPLEAGIAKAHSEMIEQGLD